MNITMDKKIILLCIMMLCLAMPSLALLRINNNLNLITGGAGNFTNVTVNQRLTTSQVYIGSGSFVGNITSDGSNFKFNIPNGTVQVNDLSVCLANGSNCASGALWAMNGANLYTETSVGIGTRHPSFDLEVSLDATSGALRILNNMTSAFSGGLRMDKMGNSTTNPGTPGNADELGNFDYRVWNGSSFVRRGLIQAVTSQAHSSSGYGTDFLIYNTPRNSGTLTQVARFGTSGLVIGSTSFTNPTHALVVSGMINTSQGLTFGLYAYPACSASTESHVAYNWTSRKHVGCNGTTWTNLY